VAKIRTRFVGIDLASSARKASAYARLTDELEISFDLLRTDSDLLKAVEGDKPALVAIDAPLGLPRGACCLEESCGCQPLSKLRECEQELAKRGIPCFFTTKRSIIKPLVYRAIGLKEKLETQGYEVIEIYPYASKICLWGRPIPSKLKPEGLHFLRRKLSELLPRLSFKEGELNHDLCDAILAAYTAWLFYHGQAEAIGNPVEGQIVIPIVF